MLVIAKKKTHPKMLVALTVIVAGARRFSVINLANALLALLLCREMLEQVCLVKGQQ